MGAEVSRQGPEKPVSPSVAKAIRLMEGAMQLPEYNHAGTPTRIAIVLWQNGTISSFADFEKGLRQRNSRVFFIAMPWKPLGDTDTSDIISGGHGLSEFTINEGKLDKGHETLIDMSQYDVVYPVVREGEPEYWLSVAVNGAIEALHKRWEIGHVTQEENVRRLRTTGVLSPRRRNS